MKREEWKRVEFETILGEAEDSVKMVRKIEELEEDRSIDIRLEGDKEIFTIMCDDEIMPQLRDLILKQAKKNASDTKWALAYQLRQQGIVGVNEDEEEHII